ncbi:uncharacterized protein lrrfip1a isoform X7 [Denticeps clupeoides]|uniref:uncharacterized protein lrrfip1a isoform X7 n=1 Tax=Denticeps clupeoides TaxID=299321 RepID=UPI0010A3C88E|nr:uncharacterized protein LOC114796482 isoform X7 [Denticeps clupeoides]
MGTQGTGRKRISNKERLTAEDDALNVIAREAEARLAAKRAARAEAREIRMKELERQQKEIYQVQKEESEKYTCHARRHASVSDDEERMSVGSRTSIRGSVSYSHKKSKKKKKKHKDRNGYDDLDDYSTFSSLSSRISDESRASRSSRPDLQQPGSYSDLYSSSSLPASRQPSASYNTSFQSSMMQSTASCLRKCRGSLYEDCTSSVPTRYSSSSTRGPSEYRSVLSSRSRTSSRASSACGSPADDDCSSVASFLRSAASSSGLLRDLDHVTIPDLYADDRLDRDYPEKGTSRASSLSTATLASLGGTSSRRGSADTAITADAEASIREIKEIHELKDQIQDVEAKYMQSLKEVKDAMVEVEDKYRKAMVSNAQLDNEKSNLMYQVDVLKDSLMELEELLSETRRECEDKTKELEREKHAHGILQFQFNELKETLKQSEELLNEIRQLRLKQDCFVREIADLQETVDWKNKKIGALERQKEYSDAIRNERDELRDEVVQLKDILKKHGIVLGPDLSTNGETGEALMDETSSTEGNSMLGKSEEVQPGVVKVVETLQEENHVSPPPPCETETQLCEEANSHVDSEAEDRDMPTSQTETIMALKAVGLEEFVGSPIKPGAVVEVIVRHSAEASVTRQGTTEDVCPRETETENEGLQSITKNADVVAGEVKLIDLHVSSNSSEIVLEQNSHSTKAPQQRKESENEPSPLPEPVKSAVLLSEEDIKSPTPTKTLKTDQQPESGSASGKKKKKKKKGKKQKGAGQSVNKTLQDTKANEEKAASFKEESVMGNEKSSPNETKDYVQFANALNPNDRCVISDAESHNPAHFVTSDIPDSKFKPCSSTDGFIEALPKEPGSQELDKDENQEKYASLSSQPEPLTNFQEDHHLKNVTLNPEDHYQTIPTPTDSTSEPSSDGPIKISEEFKPSTGTETNSTAPVSSFRDELFKEVEEIELDKGVCENQESICNPPECLINFQGTELCEKSMVGCVDFKDIKSLVDLEHIQDDKAPEHLESADSCPAEAEDVEKIVFSSEQVQTVGAAAVYLHGVEGMDNSIVEHIHLEDLEEYAENKIFNEVEECNDEGESFDFDDVEVVTDYTPLGSLGEGSNENEMKPRENECEDTVSHHFESQLTLCQPQIGEHEKFVMEEERNETQEKQHQDGSEKQARQEEEVKEFQETSDKGVQEDQAPSGDPEGLLPDNMEALSVNSEEDKEAPLVEETVLESEETSRKSSKKSKKNKGKGKEDCKMS